MDSLTHVCMWGENGWKRVTASEAARLHPGGTVSAHSGLFMCELCGQYVLLTDGTIQKRHFRHSSAEKSKNCPERRMGAGTCVTYHPIDHDLPIRIQNISAHDFELELGLIRIPENLISSKLKIEIKPSSFKDRMLVYSKERLNVNGISYLSLGDNLSEYYAINVVGSQEKIYEFWPKTVQGIDPNGSIFDGTTGKKLPPDSDVEIGKTYYVLKKGGFCYKSSYIDVKSICRKNIKFDIWNIYEIKARAFNRECACFFLNYHCRLTDRPVSLQVVWPVYEEDPYVIRHNRESVTMHIAGNASAYVFPNAAMKRFSCDSGTNNSVVTIFCNSRQQLVSAGRAKALKYMYFWKSSLNQETQKENAYVSDVHGVRIQSGIAKNLPDKNIMLIKVPCDGFLLKKIHGIVQEKINLKACTVTEIDKISWNTEICIYIGLNCIWRVFFEHAIEECSPNEDIILQQLNITKGKMIPISHVIGGMACYLSEYPRVRQWLYQCIRTGVMNEHAFKLLRTLITKIKAESNLVKLGENK